MHLVWLAGFACGALCFAVSYFIVLYLKEWIESRRRQEIEYMELVRDEIEYLIEEDAGEWE